MRFETNKDLNRETKAIELFVNSFNGSYEKLGEWDIDFKVSNSDGVDISFVEVKGRLKDIEDAFPLPIAIRKVMKLYEKRLNPLIIWSCNDGIIYSLLKDLKGSIMYGGRIPRKGSYNDQEIMAYYELKDNNFKTIKYEETNRTSKGV